MVVAHAFTIDNKYAHVFIIYAFTIDNIIYAFTNLKELLLKDLLIVSQNRSW